VSETLPHLAFHELPSANSLADPSGTITDCNEGFLRLWGYSDAREVVGRSIPEFLLNPEQTAAILAALDRSGKWEGDYTAKRKDGSTFTAHGIATRLTDEAGRMLGYSSSVTDITGQKEAAEAVVNLIVRAPFGAHFYEWTTEGRLVFRGANPAADKILGMDHQTLIGKTIVEAFPALARTAVPEAYRRAAVNGEPFDDEAFFYADDGQLSGVYQIHAFQTGPNWMATFFIDITERARTERALRESEENLRMSLQSIQDAVMATDPEGRVVRMNPTAERLTGWSLAEASGRPIREILRLVHPKTRELLENPVDRFLSSTPGPSHMDVALLYARNGTAHEISDSCAPIRDTEGHLNGVILVFRDVTLENRNREELQKMQRLQSVGALAGGVAHDFNNILMGILGNFSIARHAIPPDHPAWEHLNEAERAVQRGTLLAKQLLTFADNRPKAHQSLQVRDLAVETLRFDLAGSSIRLDVTGEETPWPIEADRGQIQQLLSNLTLNAREAMPRGGRLALSFANVDNQTGDLPILPPGKYIRITLQDEGVGIEPRLLNRIFDPYFSTKASNSGLGLATVQSIVTRHGGHISVQSEPGKGARFTVHLPATGEAPAASLPPSTRPAGKREGPARILLIDDDETLSRVIAHWLEHLGYTVETAFDGMHALSLFSKARQEEQPFDAMILDLTLPGGIGGDEVLRRIRMIDPEARAILSSGYSDGPVVAHYAEHGFKGILLKPYTEADLKAKLLEVLG
jgi:PAS domain S-box-containing protein